MRSTRLTTLALLGLSLAATACTAEVEDEGEMPKVNVEGGEMPKVDVDPAKVEVTQDTQQVVTPEVKVTPTEGDDN